MGKRQEKGYWDKRVLKDKARDVNNAEKFLQKNQKVLYAQAAKEIQQEIEKLYGKFTDQQDISIAEARRLIRVLPEDAEETARVFDLLLGDNLAGRKDYIAENGYKYLDMIHVS